MKGNLRQTCLLYDTFVQLQSSHNGVFHTRHSDWSQEGSMSRGPSSLESLSSVSERYFRGLPWGVCSPVDRQVRRWAIHPLFPQQEESHEKKQTLLPSLTCRALWHLPSHAFLPSGTENLQNIQCLYLPWIKKSTGRKTLYIQTCYFFCLYLHYRPGNELSMDIVGIWGSEAVNTPRTVWVSQVKSLECSAPWQGSQHAAKFGILIFDFHPQIFQIILSSIHSSHHSFTVICRMFHILGKSVLILASFLLNFIFPFLGGDFSTFLYCCFLLFWASLKSRAWSKDFYLVIISPAAVFPPQLTIQAGPSLLFCDSSHCTDSLVL